MNNAATACILNFASMIAIRMFENEYLIFAAIRPPTLPPLHFPKLARDAFRNFGEVRDSPGSFLTSAATCEKFPLDASCSNLRNASCNNLNEISTASTFPP